MRITVDGSIAVAVTGRLVSVTSASSPRSAPRPTVIAGVRGVGGGQRELQRALLDDVAAVGGIAGGKQHLAAFQVAWLSAPMARICNAEKPSWAKLGTRSRKTISSSIVIGAPAASSRVHLPLTY